jgi:hypothetical protein
MNERIRLPDGTVRHLNESGECADLIQEIGVEYAAASADGRRIDAECWAKAYDDAFALLPRLMIADLIEEKSKLQPIKRHAELCADWWLDLNLAARGKQPTEVSSAQRAIIAGNQFAPTSWSEAREAIDLLHEFRLPDTVLPYQAEGKARDLCQAAKRLEIAIEASIDALSRAHASMDAWVGFQHGAYQQYLKARGAFDAAAEALDA